MLQKVTQKQIPTWITQQLMRVTHVFLQRVLPMHSHRRVNADFHFSTTLSFLAMKPETWPQACDHRLETRLGLPKKKKLVSISALRLLQHGPIYNMAGSALADMRPSLLRLLLVLISKIIFNCKKWVIVNYVDSKNVFYMFIKDLTGLFKSQSPLQTLKVATKDTWAGEGGWTYDHQQSEHRRVIFHNLF